MLHSFCMSSQIALTGYVLLTVTDLNIAFVVPLSLVLPVELQETRRKAVHLQLTKLSKGPSRDTRIFVLINSKNYRTWINVIFRQDKYSINAMNVLTYQLHVYSGHNITVEMIGTSHLWPIFRPRTLNLISAFLLLPLD